MITYAPPGCQYNKQYTNSRRQERFSWGKDKWRVCRDPRPLNKLPPDDKHPVPLSSDLLQLIGEHAVYSIMYLTRAYCHGLGHGLVCLPSRAHTACSHSTTDNEQYHTKSTVSLLCSLTLNVAFFTAMPNTELACIMQTKGAQRCIT